MRIAFGADHAGFQLKERLREAFERLGFRVLDAGTFSAASCDYPDYAAPVASAVAQGECERGVLVCCTGIGMSIAANKVPGIRAARARTEEDVRLTRQHNDANVLCLAANSTSEDEAIHMVKLFLETEFEGGRHARRVAKVMALEPATAGTGANL